MPINGGIEPLEIILESQDLVLRGFSGEELDSALLNGQLILTLAEATNLKEIQLVFSGSAKVSWRDSSAHHYEHPLFFHDFNFLNPTTSTSTSNPTSPIASTATSAVTSTTTTTSSSKSSSSSHTLKAGRHVFPFTLHIPGSLPATLRTYSGTCVTEYKLKAIVTRPGLASSDWKCRKVVRIARGFGVDAVEYNQTLEIENTWPGKVMYAFTIPHKAYAAGETIPVSVKFSPLAKGVRIVSLVTTIREHTTVHSKSSQHSEARDATAVRYNFLQEPSSGTSTPHHPPPHARIESSTSLANSNSNSGWSTPNLPPFGTGDGLALPAYPAAGSNNTTHGTRLHRLLSSALSNAASASNSNLNHPSASGSGSGNNGGGSSVSSGEEEEVDDGLDTEIDIVVDVPIPIWTAPTHTVHPVFINHKLKWSAFIKNPDGHVSELRCALPIHILASSLAEEARLASAGSRNLLFGESGVLAHSDVPQVDLPSYHDHVMDRVANAETASYFPMSAGFAPTPWSQLGGATPHNSPPPSRPSSPGLGNRIASSHGLSSMGGAVAIGGGGYRSGRTSGSITPVTSVGPGSPGFLDPDHPDSHRNWIDSELLGSLSLDHTSPPGSNPASRPSSRPPSPDRFTRTSSAISATNDLQRSTSTSPVVQNCEPPPPTILARNSSSSSFFHLHIPKPLKMTSFSRNGSSASLSGIGASSSSSSHHPSPSALSSALEAHAAKNNKRSNNHHNNSSRTDTHVHGHSLMGATSPLSSSPTRTITTTNSRSPGSQTPAVVGEEEEIDFLSQVPSYDVAARGFLGGGVVPLSARLPNYEDSTSGTTSP